jgi:hypothetical protein
VNRLCWWLGERLSLLLETDEREAVRGDLQESGESGAQGLVELMGLVARRYAAPWMHWQPWLAPLGLLAPMMLMVGGHGISQPWLGWLSLQAVHLWHYQSLSQLGLTVIEDVPKLICLCLLLIGWAWTGGFAFGALARSLSWIHPALILCLTSFCGFPIAYMLMRRQPEGLLWLLPVWLVFLAPLIAGVHYGARSVSLSLRGAVMLAVGLLLLTLMVQLEDSRNFIDMNVWASGQSAAGRFSWTPEFFPFVAVLWQFGVLAFIARWKPRPINTI